VVLMECGAFSTDGSSLYAFHGAVELF